jgi:hypothetical protein
LPPASWNPAEAMQPAIAFDMHWMPMLAEAGAGLPGMSALYHAPVIRYQK